MKPQATESASFFKPSLRRIGFAAGLFAVGIVSTCQALEPKNIELSIGEETFTLEVAENGLTRTKGLMFRKDLESCGGMVFFFPTTRPVSFWMKNTPTPLWMGFVDKHNRLSHIYPRAVPFDESRISSGWPVNKVIEIHADCPKLTNIQKGMTVTFEQHYAKAR